jgi:hypothetical protein
MTDNARRAGVKQVMAVSSKQLIRARISRAKFRQIVKLFALDLTATQVTALTGLNRNTVNRYLTLIRQAVAAHCERESPFSGEVELDESYFGARRVRGKRGRGARGKTIVFGIYERDGRVYTEVVPNCKKANLQAIIRGKVELTATIHTDGFCSYDGIVHNGLPQALPSSSAAAVTSTASKASGAWQRPDS